MASPIVTEFRAERRFLVETLQAQGISDLAVLRAIESTPRHSFVPSGIGRQAYEDRPIHIGLGQTMSQPSIHAPMSPAEFADKAKADFERFGSVIRERGISVQ